MPLTLELDMSCEVAMKSDVLLLLVRCGFVACSVCVITLYARNATATNGTVAVLGSAVAKGFDAGGETVCGSYALGYAGLLTTHLAPLEWGVTNFAVSEESTADILSVYETDVVPAAPDHLFVGLSLADAGLAGAADPAAVSESFQSTLTNVIGRARASGMFAIAGLSYPHNNYSASEYAYLKAMNLLINTYDLPSANFLGAVDDGTGHWVEGFNSDVGRPNVQGHEEMFYTIVPSLFDAIRLGKTARPSPVDEDGGYATITRDPEVRAPISFTPQDTVHSFTTAFRVLSDCTGTVAAVKSGRIETGPRSGRILVDFGPTNDAKGRAAPSPDQNGNHWNSWRLTAVPAGSAISNLVMTSGDITPVSLYVTGSFDAPNGGSSFGGLMEPDPALLGDFAVTQATEDYFCTGSTAKFKVTGLDRRFSYTLRFFGTRVMEGATRTTRYTVVGYSGTFSTNMVTTGTDVGTGGYDGNNDTIAELKGLMADMNGEMEVSVSKVDGYAYLNIMEIRFEESEGEPLAVSDRFLIDFGPADHAKGRAAPSPDQNGNHWNSWREDAHAEVGTSLPWLVRTNGKIAPVALEVTQIFATNGGVDFGGLLEPDPALLGDFAVAQATEDYFGTMSTARLKITGLDRGFFYTFRFFGSRSWDAPIRTTRYTVAGGNGTFSTNLVTTGTDVGTGGYHGNNDTIAELTGLSANANGEMEVIVSKVAEYAYLNIMEIKASEVIDPDPDSLLIDFGPNDGVNGHAMTSPDSNGRYWNNFVPPYYAGAVLKNLVDSHSSRTTTVALAITKGFVSCNGINHGGLFTPDYGLLGHFAQVYATEDFFHTQTGGSSLKIYGLNKASVYTLRFFGTREGDELRVTRFTAKAGNGNYSTNMVTTGTDVGTGGYDGNNDTIAELTGLVPDELGCIYVDIANVTGTQCYISIMEVKKECSVVGTGWGTVEVRSNEIAYVASTGHEIKAPVRLDGTVWRDVAVAHSFAAQRTRLFLNGDEVGSVPERLYPSVFVLGGEGEAASGRMQGPERASYQDWCVYRSAWNAGEASAHAAGQMQQASMEICAALSDLHFTVGTAVDNRAQSLSEAVVNSAHIKQKEKGTLLLVR